MLTNSAPHDPRGFLARVFEGLQRNRTAASCAAGRDYPVQSRTSQHWTLPGPTSSAPGEPSFHRSQASWGPLPARLLIHRRLDRRQWSTAGGSRRPLLRQVAKHRCHLSKRANPACSQISDRWHSTHPRPQQRRTAAAGEGSQSESL